MAWPRTPIEDEMNRRDMTTDWDTWRREAVLPDGTTVGYIDVGEGSQGEGSQGEGSRGEGTEGDGPIALFVHGIFLSSYLWRHVIDELRTERRCIAIDLVGHGNTTAGDGVAFTMTSQADMVVALLDHLSIKQVDLVGNDTGGGVCQVIAANHPHRLRSLTLTNCDVHDNWPPTALDTVGKLAHDHAIAAVAEMMAADHGLARSADGLGVGYQYPERLSADAIAAYAGPLMADQRRARLIEDFLISPDVTELTSLQPQLAALQVPTAVIWGDADIFFGSEWAHWLCDVIPGCDSVTWLSGAKLFFPDDRAEDLVPLLTAHWAASTGS
jgi:pimeloyl-ACP methyl ester carboxylesterase